MSPFEPAGEQARWRLVYQVLQAAAVDEVVSYGQLGEVLELDPDKDRHAIQMSVRRAAREYEEVDKRALDAVPNVGYRVVTAPEHIRLARGHQRRASRQLDRGYSKAINVDLTDVDPNVRQALQLVAQAFALQKDFNRRVDARHKNLEKAIRGITEGQERTAEELAELRARLERLEGGQ